MANLFSDNFDRADSTNLGANWTERAGDFSIATNKLQLDSATNYPVVAYTAAYATADYSVQADITLANPYGFQGIFGRRANYSLVDSDGYAALFNAGQVYLYKRVSGSWTSLGSYNGSYSAGGTYTVKLVMNGDQISVSVDGVERISAVTDSSITAAGDAACGAGNTSNGGKWDNFTVDDFAGGGGATVPIGAIAYYLRSQGVI